ncbi:MAG: hypothetical protein LBM38_00970 [Clostridiales bacterium]|jgi:hypothetical protein|nr:hypothetical protein [Clostridiales bacterium]
MKLKNSKTILFLAVALFAPLFLTGCGGYGDIGNVTTGMWYYQEGYPNGNGIMFNEDGTVDFNSIPGMPIGDLPESNQIRAKFKGKVKEEGNIYITSKEAGKFVVSVSEEDGKTTLIFNNKVFYGEGESPYKDVALRTGVEYYKNADYDGGSYYLFENNGLCDVVRDGETERGTYSTESDGAFIFIKREGKDDIKLFLVDQYTISTEDDTEYVAY